MKKATFSNGKTITRETKKDYKFAYRAVATNGAVDYGFGTTRKSVEANAKYFVSFELRMAKDMYKYNLTPIKDELKELTSKLINEIEIVECETL